MCLAVIGKIVKVDTLNALSDVEGNLITINIQLTPEVREGQYVLIHAGFSIETMPEKDFFKTQALLNEITRMVNHVE